MDCEADKFVSKGLSREEIRGALLSLPQALKGLVGECLVTAMYGVGCKLHGQLLYIPMSVSTQWLHKFVADSVEQGIVVPGRSDICITTPEQGLKVLFCHEGDLHVGGRDDGLIARFISLEPFVACDFTEQENSAPTT